MIDVASFGEPMVEFCATDVGRIRDVYLFRRGWGGDTSNFIVAVAWLHDNTPFRFIAQQYKIPTDRSYFIRRVTKTAPGDYAVNFLIDLGKKLKNEGTEVIWTLGLPDSQNSVFKKAGFEQVGVTNRSGHPVFVKKL